MLDASGFITAGGRSSRMGTDKAWLQIEGQPLIKHIIAALAPITTELAIIANDDRYGTLGLAVFPDTESGIGPLEAVRSALTNCRTSRAVLVGCDLPFVTSELFDFLLRLPGEHHAVVPRGPDGKLEPLCAVYWKDLLPIAARLIESGERKVAVLFDNAPTRIVEFDEIRQLRNSQLFFENINTPEDYRRAVHKARDAMAAEDMDRRP
ncbi:MAG TPA: molybdenum cofactor guanylyltransferase [Blastocatellia bacterium]|nr:molybdenum cofactor guanylyltransferase [Blastocatellia bacterium]